jgi:ankyrin repeat protein
MSKRKGGGKKKGSAGAADGGGRGRGGGEEDPADRAQAAAIRAKTLPFMDSAMVVSERLQLHETFRERTLMSATGGGGGSGGGGADDNSSVDIGSLSVEPAQSIGPPLMTAYVLKRRYPRFCQGLTMTEQLVAGLAPRSDVWLMQMIEGSYDDAIDASYKSLSVARRRKRCGLQLGALDAFSLVCSRFIARTYSVLEVRNRISVELLVTMEAARAKGNPLNTLTKTDSLIYDTDRVTLFSKFLAEEWDLDYLAVYLHSRDQLQTHFSVRLRDLAVHGVRAPEDPFEYPEKLRDILLAQLRGLAKYGPKALLRPPLPPVPAPAPGAISAAAEEENFPGSGNALRSGSAPAGGGAERGSIDGSNPGSNPDPSAELPSKRRRKAGALKPLPAAGLPGGGGGLSVGESQEKAMPVALPPSLFFVPDAGLPEAPSLAFLGPSLLSCCDLALPQCPPKLKKYLSARVMLGVRRRLEAVAPVRPGTEGGGLNIDEDKVLIPISVFLCTLCEEWRLMPKELREKFGSVGAAAECLEKLNDVYASNCLASKERLEEIKQTEMLLSQCKATTLNLEKKIRRLERRWKESRVHASDLEMDTLRDMRLGVTQETATRLALESGVKGMRRRHGKEVARQDKLWTSALEGGEASVAPVEAPVRRAGGSTGAAAAAANGSGGITTSEMESSSHGATAGSGAAWRGDIAAFFAKAVAYNVDQSVRIARDKAHTQALKEEEAEARRAEEEAALEAQRISLETADEDVSLLHGDLSLEEYIAMVRREAEQLVALNSPGPNDPSAGPSAAPSPVRPETAKGRQLRHRLETAMAGQEQARRLVACVLETAGEGAVDAVDLSRRRSRLQRASFAALDAAAREDALADSAAAVAARRVLAAELAAAINSGVDDEVNHRCDVAVSLCLMDLCDEALARTLPDTIAERVEEVVVAGSETAETRLIEELTAAATRQAGDAYIEHLCTAASFAALETETIAMLLAGAGAIAEEEGRRKDHEKQKLIKSIMNGMLNKIDKEMANYDPKWAAIDLDPSEFLSPGQLAAAEVSRARILGRLSEGLARKGMAAFTRARAIGRAKRTGGQITMCRIFDMWRLVYHNKRMLVKTIIRMQAVARMLCRKRQVATLRIRERKVERVVDECIARKNISNAKRSMRFMLWMAQRNKHLRHLSNTLTEHKLRMNFMYLRTKYERRTVSKRQQRGAQKIQSRLRIYLAKWNLYHRRFARLIVFSARKYLCRLVLRAKRLYKQRSLDIEALKRGRHQHAVKHRQFRRWWMLSSHSRALAACARVWETHMLRAGLDALCGRVTAYKDRRTRAVTLMNSAVRRFIDQRQVLHYGKFRRGIRRMQATARGRKARKEFAVLLFLHAMATRLQKSFRGWKAREDLLYAKIRDLHYAANTNNYEKVLHYYEKYPELMVALDQDGGSLLHSAAAGAAKRTLKLILKNDRLDLNQLNYHGYSPLHLLIQSSAPDRDALFDYMTSSGFDEFQNTSGGKTCLLLATESEHLFIGQALIEDGVDGSLADNKGLTCLQAACIHGLPRSYLGRLINYANADAHCPGQSGRFPLHDAAEEGTLDNVDFLLWRGVDMNARGIQSGETALMLACKYGHIDVAKFLLLQGCNSHLIDYYGQNGCHYGAFANSVAIMDLLREGDVNMDLVDQNGDTPLHIAADLGAANAVRSLLTLGAKPSVQNSVGNQPSHVAARGNHAACLKELMTYEQFIGRMNYAHQTPLGMAKFHCAREAQAFLEHNYIFFVDDAERNKHGDIWWDKPIDEAVADWELTISEAGKRTFLNVRTGEVKEQPPNMDTDWIYHYAQNAKLPLTQKIHLKPEVHDFSAHQYLLDQDDEKKKVAKARAVYRTATIISKWARRKLVYNVVRRTVYNKKLMARFSMWVFRIQYKLKKWAKARKKRSATAIQQVYRGYTTRKWLYESGESYLLWYNRAGRYLKQMLWRAWKNHKVWVLGMKMIVVANAPKRTEQWQDVLDYAGLATRYFGLFEEYSYPDTKNLVKFYRNTFSNTFSFHQPSAWAKRDKQDFSEARFMRLYGYIPSHMRAATLFGACWRGFAARKQYALTQKAANIAFESEELYLNDPDNDRNLFNYAMYCHAFKLDYDRARKTYQEVVNRMEHAGPDIATILYAWGVFCMVSYYVDDAECKELIRRGRAAEERAEVTRRERQGLEASVALAHGTYPFGKIFNTADVGFFKRAATYYHDAENWHNYAVSRWLVYDDFRGSFHAFMKAFSLTPSEIRLKANFELMMTYFHGYDKAEKTKIIQSTNADIAQKECDLENDRLEFAELRFRKNKAALLIQRFLGYHSHRKKQILDLHSHSPERAPAISGKSIAYML